MKRALAILLALVMVLALTACGGGNKNAIVGTWRIVDESEATDYGFGIEFKKDGTLVYGITTELLGELAGGDISAEDLDASMEAMSAMMNITYKVKSDTEMEVKVSALMGLASEKTTVPYELNGDTLVFDGATYTRVSD